MEDNIDEIPQHDGYELRRVRAPPKRYVVEFAPTSSKKKPSAPVNTDGNDENNSLQLLESFLL
jgi:hypothetical protein